MLIPRTGDQDPNVETKKYSDGYSGHIPMVFHPKLIGDRQGTTKGVGKIYRWLAQLEKALENGPIRCAPLPKSGPGTQNMYAQSAL